MSTDLFRLEGKVAAVIGGARHLGYDMAEILAEAGCDVLITSRKAENAAGAASRLREQYGRETLSEQLDVRDYAQVEALAAKAGILGMTRDLAGLLSPMGIHVNAIAPGGFGPRELPPGFVSDYSDRTPLGRMGRDGIDLKGAALFLASPASDYVTGHTLVVDGGFSIWQ